MPLEAIRNLDFFDFTASWISQTISSLNFTFIRMSFVPELNRFFIRIIFIIYGFVLLSYLSYLKI